MAINIYFLSILNILIIPIKSHIDLYSILHTDDGHLYEPPTYKYSQQGNIKEFFNMNNLTLVINNIFLSIILINIIPIIIIYLLIPITILRRYQFLLRIFLSFSSGGLMANVFLRLIPYIIISCKNSIDIKNQSHIHDSRIGLFILLGIFLSFIIEKLFRYFQNNNEQITSTINSSNILPYLFLLGNFLHSYTNNFIFSSIFLMTNSTMMIINIIYEVLHVFYGYAILIYGGWSLIKAMQVQLLIKLSSFIYYLVSLQFQSNIIVELWSNQIFLPIISGIFIYISTVHIIPEVMENNNGIKETILKVVTFIISVFIIFNLKKYE